MDKQTYSVGAKPTIERFIRNRKERVRISGGDGGEPGLQECFENAWSHSDFKRHIEEAVERYCRIVEARGAARSVALRLEWATVVDLKLDVGVTYDGSFAGEV